MSRTGVKIYWAYITEYLAQYLVWKALLQSPTPTLPTKTQKQKQKTTVVHRPGQKNLEKRRKYQILGSLWQGWAVGQECSIHNHSLCGEGGQGPSKCANAVGEAWAWASLASRSGSTWREKNSRTGWQHYQDFYLKDVQSIEKISNEKICSVLYL